MRPAGDTRLARGPSPPPARGQPPNPLASPLIHSPCNAVRSAAGAMGCRQAARGRRGPTGRLSPAHGTRPLGPDTLTRNVYEYRGEGVRGWPRIKSYTLFN